MGLNGVMYNALSGLKATQAGLDVVSQNISNADSIGYIRRQANVVEQPVGDTAGFARVAGVQRMLDQVVQRQLWSESGGAGYTKARADMLGALNQVYGPPDASSSLGGVFSRFTQSLQQLKGDPANFSLRTNVVGAAQEMAIRLRSLSSGVQDLRMQAEQGLEAGVTRANDLLSEIQATNAKILDQANIDSAVALRDQRDRLVTELSQFLDIRVSENSNGALSIMTGSGVTLFAGSTAARLTFDSAAAVGPDQLWNANDAQRGVGTIRVENQFGGSYDLIANNGLRSGELAALVEMRDKTLVEAQNQLDEFAAAMTSAISDREVNGTVATAGAASGFDVDLAGLMAGNRITLNYTDSTTGATGRFQFVRTDSAAGVANVAAAALSSADNRVIGIDFSGGLASVVTQIQAALGPGFTVSNPAGSTLRILDDGAGNTRDVNALVARPGTTALSGASPLGTPELPLFVDSSAPGGLYTGSFERGSQMRGLAARIDLNAQVAADPSRLVQFQTGPTTAQGDPTRPDRIYERLTGPLYSFSPQTGIGGTAFAHRATIQNFAQRIIEAQGNTIESARRLDEGQQIALKAVEARFAERSGVSVDQEMSSLIELQNAYAANARVISAVKEMMDLLIRI
jgi:flagellar hook-associated protein 1